MTDARGRRDPAIRVLVVDDEQDFARYMAKRLRARGFAAGFTFDGATALELLDQEPYEVVLLDLLMPGLDGLSTLTAIRARHPDVRVVMLSGHTSEDMAREGLRLGAAEYLLKPCELGQLCAAIEGVAAG